MTNVASFEQAYPPLSVSAFCTAAQCKEETISRRLKVAKVAPVRTKGNAKLYDLADLLKCAYLLDDDGNLNPAGLDPFKRKAHFQAMQEEVRALEAAGEVVPKIEMQTEAARMAKAFTHCLDTMADVLERDAGLTPAQIAAVVKHCDAARDEVAAILMANDDSIDPDTVRQSA
jgi:hypothetical protein